MKNRRIISWNLIILIISTTIIQGLMPVTVIALSAGGLQTTIASIIISLMLECGVAPVNQSWLNTLNASYGVESSIGTIQDCINTGLLTQSGSTLVDTGLSAAIESQTAYTELGLAEIFTTSADDVGVIAGSGGANLANVAINCGTLGTIGAYAGAASIGVGLGVLLNKAYEYCKNFIKYGLPMSPLTRRDIAENIPDGYSRCYYYCRGNDSVQYSTYSFTDDYAGNYYYLDNGDLRLNIGAFNISDSTNYYMYKNYTNGTLTSTQNNTYPAKYYGLRTQYINNATTHLIETNMPRFNNQSDAEQYAKNLVDLGQPLESVSAPDLIGDQGNYKNGVLPSNQVKDGYDMKPVDMDDYSNYVDSANNNTEDGNTGQAVQGEQFEDLIDSLLVEPSIIPDQGVTDPEVPDRPIIPDQPTVPGKDPITGEEQSEVLQGITTPDLRAVFPFCIPFDLYNIFGVLKYEGREAPVIVWEFEILGNSYPVIIDLSPYEDLAALLRLLELLAFIVGLAVATRKLIGAGG